MKIIFLGTPHFSVSVLDDLVNSSHEVVAVVTQPDKPVGRSSKLEYPPVKEYALAHNIPVFQFERIRKKENIETLKSLNADIMITAAYGQILSQAVLDITPYGVYNVHGSLLPKYRGAAPIQWAIINNEPKTGVTIMKTEVGLDSGPMLLKEELIIELDDTSQTLFEKMSKMAGGVLLKALSLLESGSYTLTPQNEQEATHYPMLKKEDGELDFNYSSERLAALVRGVTPWPGAYTFMNGEVLKVHKLTVVEHFNKDTSTLKAGEVVLASPKLGLFVKTLNGVVRLNEIQSIGGKKLADTTFLNGKKIEEGTIFEKQSILN